MGCTACHYLFLTEQIEAIFNPLVGLKLECLAKKRLDKARIFLSKENARMFQSYSNLLDMI